MTPRSPGRSGPANGAPDVADLLRTARAALARQEYKKALPTLQEAARIAPRVFGAQLLLGICLSAVGRRSEAVSAFRKALLLNSNSAQVHYHLGVTLRGSGSLSEAEQHFAAALRLDPSYQIAGVALSELRGDRLRSTPNARTQTARATEPAQEVPLRRSAARPSRAFAATAGAARRWGFAMLIGALASIGLGGSSANDTPPDYVVWQRPGVFTACDASADGKLLAAGGRGIMLWDLATGGPVASFAAGEEVFELAFSPDGRVLASSGSAPDTGPGLRLRRVPDGKLLGMLPPTAGSRPLAFSPDGRLLAVGTDYMSTAEPLGVQLWSVKDRRLARVIGQPSGVTMGYVSSLAFSPDGKLVASADDAGAARIYRVSDGAKLATIRTDNLFLISLAFSPDGRTLAHGGMSGPRVTLTAVPGLGASRVLAGEVSERGRTGRPPAVRGIAYSPDGKLLAICDSDGETARVELFSTGDGRRLGVLDDAECHPAGSSPRAAHDLRAVRFSTDGELLAWAGSRGVVVARTAACLAGNAADRR